MQRTFLDNTEQQKTIWKQQLTDTGFTEGEMNAFLTDYRTHHNPKNNSSDQAAFYTHTDTHSSSAAHINIVPITRKNTLTPTNIRQKLRGTRVPSKSCHSIIQKLVIFPQTPKALKPSLTWLCCDFSHIVTLANTKQHSGFGTLYKCIKGCNESWLHFTIFITQTDVCSTSPPLPRRVALFTRRTAREHERTQQGLDAIGDSADTLER